jgi:hypothetical protein
MPEVQDAVGLGPENEAFPTKESMTPTEIEEFDARAARRMRLLRSRTVPKSDADGSGVREFSIADLSELCGFVESCKEALSLGLELEVLVRVVARPTEDDLR